MNVSDYEITSGYVGSFGRMFKRATDQALAEAIDSAAKLSGKSPDAVMGLLESGETVVWCKSPNFSYDHSYGIIRRIGAAKREQMTMCACGHRCPTGLVMSTSRGSSCPDCYDRMDDC